ncbi:coiled-coil domain-containing protein, partial [Terrisporobacter muris]
SIQSKYILDRLDTENKIERILVKEVDEGSEIVDSLRDLKDGILNKKFTNKDPYVNKIIHNINLFPKYRNENISFDKIYSDWENEYTDLLKYLSHLDMDLRKNQLDDNLFKKFIKGIFSRSQKYEIDTNEILVKIVKLKCDIDNRIYNNREYESYKETIKDIYNEYIKISNNLEKVKVISKLEEEWNNKKAKKVENMYDLNKKIENIDNDILEIQGRFDEELYNSVNIKIKRLNEEIESISKEINPIALNQDIFRNKAKKISDRINILKPKFKKERDIDPIVKGISNILDDMHQRNYFEENIKDNLLINSGNIVNIKKELKRLVDEEVIGYINNAITDEDKEKLELIIEIKANINSMKQEYNGINKEKEKINKKLAKLNSEKNNILKELIKEEEELKGLGDKFEPNLERVKLKKISEEMYKFKELEELPKVGKLYSDKKGNNRELAISNWEDLDIGEEEAIRLNANLVCEIG